MGKNCVLCWVCVKIWKISNFSHFPPTYNIACRNKSRNQKSSKKKSVCVRKVCADGWKLKIEQETAETRTNRRRSSSVGAKYIYNFSFESEKKSLMFDDLLSIHHVLSSNKVPPFGLRRVVSFITFALSLSQYTAGLPSSLLSNSPNKEREEKSLVWKNEKREEEEKMWWGGGRRCEAKKCLWLSLRRYDIHRE